MDPIQHETGRHERLARRAFLQYSGALLVLGAGTGLLAACGQAAPSAQTAAPAPPSTAAATGTSVAKPVAAATGASSVGRTPTGELKLAQPAKIIALDPHGPQSADRPTLTAARQIFDSLTVRDPASGQIQPGLAASWQTPDDRTWVFTLRQGVKFHDGSPVTSADVKASFERVQKLKGPMAPLWSDVEAVETPDPNTVRLKTKSPIGTALTSATLLFVGPAGKMDAEGFFSKPIGSGPFKVTSFRPDAELRLEANADHWGGAPGVKNLTFREIPETAARVTALETGEIDFTWGLPPDQLPGLRRNAELQFDQVPSFAYYFVWFNAKREPFTDKRVRQAMIYALDVDTMIKDLIANIGKRAQAPIPATVFGFAAQTPYTYDPAKAKQLLAEAGKPNGFETSMIWTPGGSPQDRELSQAMISYWDKVGVKVRSQEQERAQWLKDLLALNWDLDFQSNSVLTGDADYTLRRLYVSSANRTGYANPQLDTLLNDAAQKVDQKQRQDLYAQADKIIWDDAVGIFPADMLENYVYRKKRVSGFVADPAQMPSFARVTVAG